MRKKGLWLAAVRSRTVPMNERQLHLDMSGMRLGLAESTWEYVTQNPFKIEKFQTCNAKYENK
jgi:hypothetical protein